MLRLPAVAADAGITHTTARRWLGGPEAGFLAKSGQTLSGDFLDSLAWWRDLAGQTDAPALLVDGGDESCTRRA